MPIPHTWDLTPQDAVTLQKQLAREVDILTPLEVTSIRYVAGVDVSVKAGISRAAIVVLSFPELTLVETVTASRPAVFPYISGLLSFREGPVILEACDKLQIAPDVFIFDGMGVMHPRRLGLAAHIGLWWDRPTVGCGKNPSDRRTCPLGEDKGVYQTVQQAGEEIGVVLRTRSRVKPLYVSAGHRATHDSARQLIMQCVSRYRLPEPIRAAHRAAGNLPG